jgi:hypothetical protein
MGLSPLRNALGQTGLAAYRLDTPFKNEADAALASFQSVRSELERQVRQGDLTLKAARERASSAAQQLREHLSRLSENYSPVPRLFLDRLVTVSDNRKRARELQTTASLQRENNQLLRQLLIEHQIVNRASEFEGKTYARPLQGGPATPTLSSLLTFHETSAQAGDEAALEWTRRQLEGFRNKTLDSTDQRRIDQAVDRPDRVNLRLVQSYVEAVRGQSHDQIEVFVHEAIQAADANACAAAFLMAREAPEGTALAWVRSALDGVDRFPESALAALRSWEAGARSADAEAARTAADFTATIAELEARFPELDAPSPGAIARRERIRTKPVAQDDEPIGLNLSRRGLMRDDLTLPGIQSGSPDSGPSTVSDSY